jgi:omega-6 fatty acid desaturase (delta-12 desaturase)
LPSPFSQWRSAIIWAVGIVPFLVVHLPIVLLAGAAGVWLFYVQHQFEETHWSKTTEWQFQHAALHGASHYDLPPVLRWITGNIGVHHVHHLASRIPYYRLPEVLRDHPELADIGRITFMESLQCVKLVLWDEKSRKLVSFRDAANASLRPPNDQIRARQRDRTAQHPCKAQTIKFQGSRH